MRRALLALVGLMVASCAGEAVPPLPGPAVSPGPMPEVLATPRVAVPDAGRPRYDRAAYQPQGWADDDGDGCNTREEVLIFLRS